MFYVLQVGMTRNIGGLETYLIQQFRNLNKQNIMYDFVNITAEYGMAFSDEILQSGGKIYSIVSRHSNPLKHYWQWISLLKAVKGKYRAIVLNANSLEYVFPLIAAAIFGIPIRVIHSHNAGFDHEIGFLRKLLMKFNSYFLDLCATDYFACSKKAEKWMFGNKRICQIIPNAIDVESFRYDSAIRQKKREELNLADSIVIGHVGRFSYQKNHEFLVLIFFEITQLCPDAKLLLIGDAVETDQYLQNTKNLVREYGLEDKVLFLGKRMDVNQLMQAMDCFVLPSRFEGLPLVGIEAQAAGLPCVVSDVVTKELDVSGSIRFVSLQEDVLVWANAIVEAVQGGRRDNVDMIKQQGYDIRASAKKIEQFFCERV